MTETIFYMVFLENERNPAFKHQTLSLAENEAKRLAMVHNKKSYVLKSLKSFVFNNFIETPCTEDYLPF